MSTVPEDPTVDPLPAEVEYEPFPIRQAKRLAATTVTVATLGALGWGWDRLGGWDTVLALPGWAHAATLAVAAALALRLALTDGIDEDEIDDDGEALPGIPRWILGAISGSLAFAALLVLLL